LSGSQEVKPGGNDQIGLVARAERVNSTRMPQVQPHQIADKTSEDSATDAKLAHSSTRAQTSAHLLVQQGVHVRHFRLGASRAAGS